MYFLLALTSMLAYAIHNLLITRHARQMDGLSLAIYRNLSLIIGMSPLFFFISWNDLKTLPTVIHWVIIGGFFGAVSVTMQYLAFQRLPMGIASSFMKTSTLFLTLWAFVFLGEKIPLASLFAIFFIISAIFYLGIQKNHMPHLNKETEKGIAYALGNAFIVSIAFYFMSKASRAVNPLMAGYFWEVFIGISALLLGLLRQLFFKKPIDKISPGKFSSIAAIGTLTTIGTGGYALAVTLGPLGIVSAVGAVATVVLSIFSTKYHKEKLSKKQWIGIIAVILGIIALKITSDL